MKCLLALAVLFIVGCSSLPNKEENHLIVALMERGSIKSMIHPIRYHVECTSKEDVEYIEGRAHKEGFSPELLKYTKYSKDDTTWVLSMQKDSPLDMKYIQPELDLLTVFQEGLVCQRVGWGSDAVPGKRL